METRTKLKQIFRILVLLVALQVFFSPAVYAAGEIVVNPSSNPDAIEGLGSYNIPTFLDISAIKNFSIFSYLSLFLQVVIVFMVVYWIVKVIRAGVGIIQKSESGFEDARKKFTAVFTSIAILFLFIVIISLVAAFLGIGNFFQWPKFLSVCNTKDSNGRQQYYFSVFAKNSSKSNAEELTDAACLQ